MVAVGGWLVLGGVLVFFVGAAYGVPRVFVGGLPEERLALLTARARAWRLAQIPYSVGPLLVGIGVLVTAIGWSGVPRLLAGAAGAMMFGGALLWSVTCLRRGQRMEEFVRGELPAGPWRGYVWLTMLGLALLGLACLGVSVWIAALLLISAVVFAAAFVVMRDIPPFVFYLVLGVVGSWIVMVEPG
ncbi:MAG: hypothetical protein ABIQ18_35720 [Umezawaea sp.]